MILPESLVGYIASVYICLASATVCDNSNALWTNWAYMRPDNGMVELSSPEKLKQICIDTMKKNIPKINAPYFTMDGSKEGERLKIRIECEKGVDI
jgi:hypothetical protein